MIIRNFNDFVKALLASGFSMGGGNDEGIFSVINFSWDKRPDYETPVRWHTGDPETDPWEWRMRVLDERSDIAYAKVFFRKSGYIIKDWYPYFLAARRTVNPLNGKMSFEDEYKSGKISQYAKRIYKVISEHERLPFHEIKLLAGFDKEDKSRFETALVELQMKLFITICGRQQKISREGMEYGWSSTVFTTSERFFSDDILYIAANISQQEAFDKIRERIYKLNPAAEEKKIAKFIRG
ncbi:MAG: AlkZ-related protein [Saccharofermentanales bacterium]